MFVRKQSSDWWSWCLHLTPTQGRQSEDNRMSFQLNLSGFSLPEHCWEENRGATGSPVSQSEGRMPADPEAPQSVCFQVKLLVQVSWWSHGAPSGTITARHPAASWAAAALWRCCRGDQPAPPCSSPCCSGSSAACSTFCTSGVCGDKDGEKLNTQLSLNKPSHVYIGAMRLTQENTHTMQLSVCVCVYVCVTAVDDDMSVPTHRSSRVMSTPTEGAAFRVSEISIQKCFMMSFKDVQPVCM